MINFKELANSIRILSIDAIQKANSGHPGMPLGMADIAAVLWHDFLRHDPKNPNWINRDRFVISNGHGSMLLYSLLHLTGYDLTIDDIKKFRQLHSRTPGHPEYGCAPGVETTTGPLGQGLGNAVGMALAEKMLAAQFNRPGHEIINHYTYAFCGDGCLMEGISHEACSLAGTHALGKLIVFWDNNHISIDGDTSGWFTDDTAKRFEAYNWHVIEANGHDFNSIRRAITEAREVKDKPTLICCKTIIGYGAPNVCGLHDCHGTPLGVAEVAATRKNLNWRYPPFNIPSDIYKSWDARDKGKKYLNDWQQLFANYKKTYPELAAEFARRVSGKLPLAWHEHANAFIKQTAETQTAMATRQSSQKCIENYAPLLPEFFGGSADLTSSNLTNWSGSVDLTKENPLGNYMHYGVREFGMCVIMSGINLHGGFIPYGGAFLVFADYAKPAIRLAAMMRRHVIYVLTHDSIGLGEDGPTHQPVEQLTMLRATPHLSVWRPCDTLETAVAWKYAIEHVNGPTCLVLSRQKTEPVLRDANMLANVQRGGYVLFDGGAVDATAADDDGSGIDCIIIATGSEVNLAINAAKKLAESGKKIRVVSMPAADVFDAQDEKYKESVLPTQVTKRIAIEAAACDYWYKYVGLSGKIIGMRDFGESAPAQEIFKARGFTVENVIAEVQSLL